MFLSYRNGNSVYKFSIYCSPYILSQYFEPIFEDFVAFKGTGAAQSVTGTVYSNLHFYGHLVYRLSPKQVYTFGGPWNKKGVADI